MKKQTNIDLNEKHSPESLSLRFLGDGSIVVKKGSSSIQKNGSSATVTGSLVKLFKDDVLDDIGLVQKCFTMWMSELRLKYGDKMKSSYHDESILISSIKYTKILKTLVVVSLPAETVKSDQALSAGSNDPVPFSGSDSIESEAPVSGLGSVLNPVNKKIQTRHYSTKALLPYYKINNAPSVKQVCLFSRVPPVIRLERSKNGSFYFSGLESVDVLHGRHLKDILDGIIGKVRELESVNDKGYQNSTRLSDYPVLSGYLIPYVKSKKLESMSMKDMNEKDILNTLDKVLTLNEKRVLVVWFYSLFNLNMYYLIIDILDKMGDPKTIEYSDEVKDLIEDFKTYASRFYGNISPSIRESLRQRGITISKNIYSGFDTEYKNIDMKENQIISAQWAVNSKLILTMPYLVDYDLSGMNTSSGEVYPINSMWFQQEKIDFTLLQDEIRLFISRIRMIRYSSNDISLKAITKGLIKVGIPYFIENGKINFSFSRTPIKTYIKTKDLDSLDLKKLVQIGINLESKDLDSNEKKLYSLLKSLNVSPDSLEKDVDSVRESNYNYNYKNLTPPDGSSIEVADPKIEDLKPDDEGKGRYSRTTKASITTERLSITTRRNFYIIGHLTQADLSLLSDFSEIKKHLDIVNKCMVTLGKSDIVLHGHNVIFRDTLLLAPGGKKSLAAIGSMYGDNLQKISLTEDQYKNMDILLKDNPGLFREYALRDSLISLVHACILEDANFKNLKLNIPLTLSSLGKSNLYRSWKQQGYKGYQISKDNLIGDSRKIPTPKGLFTVGNVGLCLNNYIASYKGGRNESYMIGSGNSKIRWKDYDLTAAYTTAMAMLGDPNYDLARRLNPSEIKLMSDNELLYSYTTIEVKNFRFPSEITYPSIGCFADEITTVYPLNGKGVLSGSEYITAKNQGCYMDLQGGTVIPFKLKNQNPRVVMQDAYDDWRIEWEGYKNHAFPHSDLWAKPLSDIFKDMPFRTVISELQSERRKHPKGTISNLLYKEMGNSLYGSVTKGIGHKMKFDIKSNKTIRMEASDISNPVLATWITSYVRSLLGELLQNVDDIGGKVVSVTTDGFITDVSDLESCVLTHQGSKQSLLKEYRKMRDLLSDDPTALELKREGSNLMSWTTRGQLSVDMKLKAVTGLQTKDQNLSETWALITEGSRVLGKTVSFTSTNLRSAVDIYKYGGHVTMEYRDQDFRLWYNNNRLVLDNVEKLDDVGLLSSRPVKDIEEALTLRRYSNLTKGGIYQKVTGVKSINKYKSYLELGVRTFIKDIVNNRNGLNMSMFNGYKGIIDFIRKYIYETDQKLKRSLDSSYVSQIKMRSLNKIPKPRMVPRLPVIIKFFDYVKATFVDYDTSLIFTKS
jgi:hypothetical protein